MNMKISSSALLTLLFASWLIAQGQTPHPTARVALLNFGETQIARAAADRLSGSLAVGTELRLVDRDLAGAAARGIGYANSLNLTVQEARDLGAAIDCDFYLIGDVQTLRRSPSSGPAYFESYASLFLISARTGKLISWERPAFEQPTAAAAEKLLLN